MTLSGLESHRERVTVDRLYIKLCSLDIMKMHPGNLLEKKVLCRLGANFVSNTNITMNSVILYLLLKGTVKYSTKLEVCLTDPWTVVLSL